jgi:hypothetical protein
MKNQNEVNGADAVKSGPIAIFGWLAVGMFMAMSFLPQSLWAAYAPVSVLGQGVSYGTLFDAGAATDNGNWTNAVIYLTGPVTETGGTVKLESGASVSAPDSSPQTVFINTASFRLGNKRGSYTFYNIVFQHSVSVTSTSIMNSRSSDTVKFVNCKWISDKADGVYSTVGSNETAIFERCEFIGNGNQKGVSINNTTSVMFINCIFKNLGNVGLDALNLGAGGYLLNCDFIGSKIGIRCDALVGSLTNKLTNSFGVTNCAIFVTSSPVTAISNTASGSAIVSVRACVFDSGFSTQSNVTTSNVYSSSPAAEFVNATSGSEDLHIKDTVSKCYNAGEELNTFFTNDFENNSRGTVNWDIGAYKYISGGTPTHTKTWTPTDTWTPTVTPSGPTNTFTKTYTPAAATSTFTPTSTFTRTPTTVPAIPTNTFTPTFTRTPTVSPTPNTKAGLPDIYRLYDLEYIPCPISSSTFLASEDLTRDSMANPKNTARWIIKIKNLPSYPTNSKGATIGYHIIETRMGTAPGAHNGIGGVTGDWSSAGSARVTLGDDLVTYAEGVTVNPQNLSRTYVWVGKEAPNTEKYQFLGDARYNPYADVKAANGYNWYFGKSSSTWTNYGGFTKAVSTASGWSPGTGNPPDGKGYGGLSVDIARYHALFRKGFLNTQAVFSFLNGWSNYYFGMGGEFGADTSPFAKGLTIVSKPWNGTSNAVSVVNEIAGYNDDPSIKGLRLVSKHSDEKTNHWHASPWLGELFPDDFYESAWKQGASTQTVGGNLPLVASGSATFYRASWSEKPIQPSSGITINYPLYTAVTGSRVAWAQKGYPGAPSFFMGNSTGSGTNIFNHKSASLTVAVSALGINLGLMFNNPVPYYLSLTRPFGLDISSTTDRPSEWGDATYPLNTLSVPSIGGLSRIFYPSGDANYPFGMATLNVKQGSQNCYAVLNGCAPSGETGPQILANLVLLQLMRGFFDAGQMTGTDHIVQLPLLAVLNPQNSGVIDGSSGSVSLKWQCEWTRWAGNKYTEEYPDGYSESVTMIYVMMFKGSGDSDWRFVRSPNDINLFVGQLPTGTLSSGTAAADVTWDQLTYNWNVSALAAGSYKVRVEGYRNGYNQCYTYHEAPFTLNK